jgi:hypothetical protein
VHIGERTKQNSSMCLAPKKERYGSEAKVRSPAASKRRLLADTVEKLGK